MQTLEDLHRPELTVEMDREHEGVCVVTLNRPDKLNALDGPLVEGLGEVFTALGYIDEVRVVILTGAGEKAFCAGADLKERATMSPHEVRKRIDDYGRSFKEIEGLAKPVLCAINGYAFGGGLELALATDIRLMASETKVGLTELRLGIIPGAGGTQRLPRLIGASRAKELIFTAARLDAPRALELGIVNHIAPRADLLDRARALAAQMLDSAPIALAQAKIAIDAGLQADLETGLAIESRAYAVTIPTEDRLEGLEAFKQGRKPVFKAR